MVTEITFALSLAAFLLSLVSLYYQWFKVRGPVIELLNVNDTQGIVPNVYTELPKKIQDDFPERPVEHPEYALVKVVYGNSGDRTGIASIQSVRIRNSANSVEKKVIRFSYSTYTVIPAYEIIEQEILLSNIKHNPDPVELEIGLNIERTGYHPGSGKYLRKGTILVTLPVTLRPAEKPPRMI